MMFFGTVRQKVFDKKIDNPLANANFFSKTQALKNFEISFLREHNFFLNGQYQKVCNAQLQFAKT